MGKSKFYILIFWVSVALTGCNDDLIEEPFTTNSVISTRFMNSDSIAELSTLITDITANIGSLSESVQTAQSDIDSLNSRITEEPDSEFIAAWEELISKLTATKEQNELAITSLQSENTTFNAKRDSLNQGYSILNSITNLLTGETLVLDTLLTTFSLPLDFNTNEAKYSISVADQINEITLSYLLEEEISLEGKVRLIVTDLMVIESEFSSLTITDEDIYIFHY